MIQLDTKEGVVTAEMPEAVVSSSESAASRRRQRRPPSPPAADDADATSAVDADADAAPRSSA